MVNSELRRLREATQSPSGSGLPMTRAELADAVNEHVWSTTGKQCSLDADMLSRYERGQIRWPSAIYRDGLRAVLGAQADGDLGFHPTPRGRAASPKASVAPARSEAGPARNASMEMSLAAIAQALTAFPSSADGVSSAVLLHKVETAHGAYQGAQYLGLARALPGLIATVGGIGGTRIEQAVRSHVHLVTAKLLTKIGDAHLAHLSADRALQAALLSEQAELVSATAFQVACTVLKIHGAAEAERISGTAFGKAGTANPTQVSTKPGHIFRTRAIPKR